MSEALDDTFDGWAGAYDGYMTALETEDRWPVIKEFRETAEFCALRALEKL